MIKQGNVLALFLLMHSQSSAANAADVLQGRIEQRNAPVRVMRPSTPSRPLGNALEQFSQVKTVLPIKSPPPVASILDKGNFSSFTKSMKGTADGADKELLVAWEQWHKNICAGIYDHWLSEGRVPGNGVVAVTVSRFGDINYTLQNFYVDASEQYDENQKAIFEESIARTLHSLDRNLLRFPLRSRRSEVHLTTTFAHSDREGGPQGYTWKRGDVERVHQ